ncbi:hypothetical protein TUMEXPCC7403_23075 [Tumidithrix helvetica PCC 7403]|uniref:hypothetical protein n=1 Tax=Tumidithrix helvetica TaxID=3457545 RepID=UPI003CC014D2
MQGTKNQESRAHCFALALHTTTDSLELAIAQLGGSSETKSPIELGQDVISDFVLVKEQSWHLGRDLSTQLHGCLQSFIREIAWSDIAWFAIASGIGGYTGTRIGIVTARTLAEQLGIPLYAIDCDRISQQAAQSQPEKSLSYSLLELAYAQWLIEGQHGIYSHWSAALPLYRE